MKTKDAIVKRIEDLSIEKGLSINALAYKSGISPSTLKNIMYGYSNNPGILTIKIICDGLNISFKDFFNCDLFDDLEQEIE